MYVISSGRESISLTEIDPRISVSPLSVTAGTDTIVQIVEGEDRPVLGIPRPAERAFLFYVKSVIRLCDVRLGDIDTILVLKRRVCTLPGCDTATATTQLDIAVCYPAGSEAVEEVGLAAND